MKLCVLFHRLGPYHHARLNALAERCNLSVIEFSTVDNTYAWDVVEAEYGFPVTSLFTDADIETKPAEEILTKIRSALSKIKPDIVAIPGWSSSTSIAALQWCYESNIPAILMSDSTAHDEPRRHWKEWVKSRMVRLFSSALVGGEPHIDYVATLGLAREQVFTGYDVVNNTHFQIKSEAMRRDSHILPTQYGLPDHYFLASNRFIDKKNLPRLLAAYAAYVQQAGSDAWGLVLLGDGLLKSALLEQVACLDIAERVQFPGFKQYNELPVFYELANVFIQASTTEQWGLVVNEAMASGLPVLVSERCGCALDLVEEGLNGFTFDPYDIEALSNLMLKVSSDDCDREAMGRASQEIIKRWTPETFAKGLFDAAQVARNAPRAKISLFERLLLNGLIRR